MTTNHRPTLESKSGKAIGIANTIAHSRALPQQTELKYRNDIEFDSDVGHRAVEELKRELLISEGKIDNKRAGSFEEGSFEDGAVKRIRLEESDSEDESALLEELAQLKKDREPAEPNHAEESEYSSESDSDSDEENRLLLEELAKIKQERKDQLEKSQQEEKTKKAMAANPLVSIDGAPEKKSWRSSTAFNKKPSPTKKESESFTNDTLKSDFHKKFLSKYVR